MANPYELERYRRVLDLALKEINQGHPDAALELIRPVKAAIESQEGTVEWAELPLVIGGAQTLLNNKEEALSFLNEAAERVEKLHDPPVSTSIRVDEYLGNFYRSCVRRRATARDFYVKAKAKADEAGFVEDSDELHLRIYCIDLENDEDPSRQDFVTLRGVGNRNGFTAREQRDAWDAHLAKSGSIAKKLKAARNFGDASEEYFLNILNSIRNEKNNKQVSKVSQKPILGLF